jgi:hypothetical protein
MRYWSQEGETQSKHESGRSGSGRGHYHYIADSGFVHSWRTRVHPGQKPDAGSESISTVRRGMVQYQIGPNTSWESSSTRRSPKTVDYRVLHKSQRAISQQVATGNGPVPTTAPENTTRLGQNESKLLLYSAATSRRVRRIASCCCRPMSSHFSFLFCLGTHS